MAQTVRDLAALAGVRTNDLRSQEVQLQKLAKRRRPLEAGDPGVESLDHQIECTETKLRQNFGKYYRERLPGLPEPRLKLLVDAHIKEIKEK